MATDLAGLKRRLYGLPAIEFGVYGVLGPKWLVAVHLMLLLPTFITCSGTSGSSPSTRPSRLGLDEYAFRVANLPLLVNGAASRVKDELAKVGGAAAGLVPQTCTSCDHARHGSMMSAITTTCSLLSR